MEENISLINSSPNGMKNTAVFSVIAPKKDGDLQDKPRNDIIVPSMPKRHITIPVHVIESIVSNHISHTLTNEMYQIIADYCSNKLSLVIKSAIDSKNYSSKMKLSVADFKRGLYLNDEKVLKDYELPVSKKETTRKRKNLNLFDDIEDTNNRTIVVNSIWLYNKNPFLNDISQITSELKNYFNVVTKVLLIKNEDMCLKVYQNLTKNCNILKLVPYFVEFFSFNILDLRNNYQRVSILLNALRSFLLNSNLYLGDRSFLSMLASALLKFLTTNVPSSNFVCDFWLLKDMAANLLADILIRRESQVYFYIVVNFLESVFCDYEESLFSHYGAIASLNSLGVPAILLGILPHIDEYFKYLNVIYEADFQQRHIVNIIQGQLIHSYYILTRYYVKYELNRSCDDAQLQLCLPFYYISYFKNSNYFPSYLLFKFIDFYGDTLVQHFPLLNWTSYNLNCHEHNLNSDLPEELISHEKSIPVSNNLVPDECEVNGNSEDEKVFRSKCAYFKNRKYELKVQLLKEVNKSTLSKSSTSKPVPKNPTKESKEQVFDVSFENRCMKKCHLKFGKINGVYV